LHDDVIDGDEERRHRTTVWAHFGIGPAVIAGDALVMLALRSLLDRGSASAARAATLLVASTEAMITGQAVDMAFETRSDVTLEECLEMAGGKTGALLGCAASIGAVLADADDDVVDALGAFGRHLGLSFQAIDDLLGIWGQPDVTGKQAWSDLHQQKKSIPIVFALTRGDSTSEELRAVFSTGELGEREVAHAAELIERCGGRELTESTAREHLELATAALDAVSIADTARTELVELAEFVAERDF
jgi:geranylgeranyl diphosphate synthase type I